MTLTLSLLAALVLCNVCAFLYLRAYLRRRTAAEAVLADVRDEVNHLLARIDETTERDVTVLEDREKSLRKVIEEADRRLKVYSRELDRSVAAERAYRDLGKAAAGGAPAAAGVTKAVPAAGTAAVPSAAPAAGAPPRAEPAPAAAAAPVPEKPKTDQIRDLARAGFSPRVIAARLGISVSEAELAVAIMEKRPLDGP